jgi:3-hydroxybutyryl-CoA dehydratase
MQVGDKTSWERTFTVEEVLLFGQLSGDQGIHHVQLDAQGRLMVQGLLTATIPTKLGGDMNYIARNITFEFVRPVFTGDTVHCETTITQYEHADGISRMSATWECHNQHGKLVLTGHTSGVIREPRSL